MLFSIPGLTSEACVADQSAPYMFRTLRPHCVSKSTDRKVESINKVQSLEDSYQSIDLLNLMEVRGDYVSSIESEEGIDG